MNLLSKKHIPFHVVTLLLIVWAITVKLDVFKAGAVGSFTLQDPVVLCENNVPKVQLWWTPSENALTYTVQRRIGDASTNIPFSGALMSQLITTEFADTRYASSYGRTAYSYRIVSYRGAEQAFSNSISVILPECDPLKLSQTVDPFANIATSTTAIYGATTTSATTSATNPLPVATSVAPKKTTTKKKPVQAITTTTQAVQQATTNNPTPVATNPTPTPVVTQTVTSAPTVQPATTGPTVQQTTTTNADSLPIGYLELPYFATSSIAQGTSITFTGSGDDLEGKISGYEWRLASCTTGTVLSTATTFTKSDFPAGLTYVYFRVKDGAGQWSTNCQRRAIIVSASSGQSAPAATAPLPVAANSIPTTGIVLPVQNSTTITSGTSITLGGTASDSDGTIAGYEWRDGNCTTGTLVSTAASFSKSDFTQGTHIMYFRAKDNSGAWSTSCVSRTIIVTAAAAAVIATTTQVISPVVTPAANKIPTATISVPALATTTLTTGQTVSFTGVGVDTDGTISSYEWRVGNCTAGPLIGTASSFNKSDFAVGSHKVYFRVKDNTGAWSTTCPMRAVVANAPVVATAPTPPATPSTPPVTTTPTPPTTQTTTPSASGKFPSWMKWGAFVGWQDTAMSNFESLVGKQPQMEAVFTHWGNDQFPSYVAPRVRDKGRTLVIFWEAVNYNKDYFNQPEYSYDSVIAGNMDAYFTKFAADAKAYGGEIILAPYSEFNSDWFPWGITLGNNSPQKMIAAWKHIHGFFGNVPNVKFAWVPNNDSIPDTAANNFDLAYPGSAYVDIVGIDAFNSNPWETFDQMLGAELVRLKKYNKPIYILSMGVKADARKAAWITDAFTTQLYKYPEVKGWVWFNENKEFDWRVNSSADSLNAFKNMIP